MVLKFPFNTNRSMILCSRAKFVEFIGFIVLEIKNKEPASKHLGVAEQ